MHETFATRIKRTQTIPEALLVIAEGLDAVLHQAEEPTPVLDALLDWSPHGDAAVPARFDVEQLRQQVAEASGDDRRALEAQLRLAEDEGQALDIDVPLGTPVTVDDDIVSIPPPNAARKRQRMEFMVGKDFNLFIQDPADKLEPGEQHRAYVAGGPHWLYLYDRDAVIEMPVEWRRAMVADIEQDSPRMAQEIARDILKDASAVGTLAVAEDA